MHNAWLEESRILTRLTALRRTIRRRLLAYGVCAVLAGGIVAFLVAVTLDWLLWLPAALRAVGVVAFVCGFVAAVRHWVFRPLCAAVTVDEIAGQLERHFGHLQDRLTSAVNFLGIADAGSPTMMRRVVLNTDRVLDHTPLASALSLRPLVVRMVLLALSMSVFVSIAWFGRDWVRTGMYRYIYPMGEIEWPRRVSIAPLTGRETVAIGDSLTVRMRVVRGLNDALRGIVVLRDPDGTTASLAMQRDIDGTFYATIDAITRDVQYWFEAGDDSTQRTLQTIHAVRRPEVAEALIEIQPPPYAADRPARVRTLDATPVRAPIGGHIVVAVRVSKPVVTATDAPETGLRLDDETFLPFTPEAGDSEQLTARFPVVQDVRFRIELVDVHGLHNRGSDVFTVEAMPDMPPSVTLVEPKGTVEATTNGAVRVVARVEDDFGISRLELQAETLADADVRPGSLVLQSLLDRVVPVTDDAEILAMAPYDWHLANLHLAAGDIVVYRVVATDNFATSPDGDAAASRRAPGRTGASRGAAGHTGASGDMRIKIISDVEFEIRLRDDLALLEARIRQARLDQLDVLDRTTTLVRATDGGSESTTSASHAEASLLSVPQRDTAAALAAEQTRLVRRVRELARRFRALTERMARNHAGADDTRRRIADAADELLRIATEPMATASGHLRGVNDEPRAIAQHASLRTAADQEQLAADGLESLIRTMTQWGSFHGLLAKTKDLLDRQQALRRTTTEIGETTLGKPVDALTPEEHAELTRNKRTQEQLGGDVEQLLARMRQLLEQTGETDRADAATLEDALRAAQSREVLKHLRAAAAAIEANRTAAAAIDQRTAEDAIRKIIDALNQRNDRRLAELRKHLRSAEEQVADLIAQQQLVRDATEEAARMGTDDTTLGRLADRQHTLQRNTRLLGEDLADVVRAVRAARLVRQAVAPMVRAEDSLRTTDVDVATARQDDALATLRAALEQLETLADETAQEAMRRSLAQIREALSGMVEAQRSINRDIDALVARAEGRRRLSRAQARRAAKLARDQAGVRARVDELRPELEKVVVYDWALQRVAGWMDTARDRLDRREVDDELVATTTRIVRELEKLIGAIAETEAIPLPSEFAEANTGGGDGGRGDASGHKPIPTIAELLVLKAMQMDVNRRTRALHDAFDPDDATEQQLRELQMVGEDQAEVQRLTQRVTQRARQP